VITVTFSSSRGCAVGVYALVERSQRPLDAQAAEKRHRASERPARRTRKEEQAERDRPDDEDELDPQVDADVVAADREQEADRGQGERRRTAERSLEQDRAGHVAAPARMPSRSLVDPHRVTADCGRQDLPCRVRDQVRAEEPAEPVADPAGR
jgi:hypothetical protein